MTQEELLQQRDLLLDQGLVQEAQQIELQLLDIASQPPVDQQPLTQQPVQQEPVQTTQQEPAQPATAGISEGSIDPNVLLQDIRGAGHPDPEAFLAQIELYGSKSNFTGIEPSLIEGADVSNVEENFTRALQVDIDSYNDFGGSRRKARAYFMKGSTENPPRAKIKKIESRADEIQEENDPKIQADKRRDLLSVQMRKVVDKVIERNRGIFDADPA